MKGRVLLTGAQGMVGRNIREHALAGTWDIHAPGRAELDLTDFSATLSYVHRVQPDFVIHAAGRVGGIQANLAAPVEFLVTNLDVGRNIILAACQAGVPHLLNLGSSCMYPRNAPNPLGETSILSGELEPTNEGYAIAKIVAERLCRYIRCEQPELQYKTMIPCNLYGRHDKFSPEHSHMIPAVIHKLHQAFQMQSPEVDIWGDGLARREFMYAGDFADAVMHALDHFETMPDLINIGLGQDYTINEYYETVAAVVGWHGHFRHDLSKPVGMKRKLVSIERQTAWGWRASTGLSEGIRKTYDYYMTEYLK